MLGKDQAMFCLIPPVYSDLLQCVKNIIFIDVVPEIVVSLEPLVDCHGAGVISFEIVDVFVELISFSLSWMFHIIHNVVAKPDNVTSFKNKLTGS